MEMIPYANPRYFVLLAVAVLPIIFSILAFKRRIYLYEALITLFFLWLSFGGKNLHQGIALLGYVAFQMIVVFCYQFYRKKANNSIIFYLSILISLIPLIFVKITPLAEGHPSIFGFLGISYLTFKTIQILMELRDGALEKVNPRIYISFLLFFPTISSGPIDRYRRFAADYQKVPEKEHYFELLNKGIFYIFLGFLYKFLIGYYLGTVLLPPITHQALLIGGMSWQLVAYMYVYGLYLFFDFGGYSLFAVGASYMMGYETPMNFNKPFLSWNIKEFWNRWHMTLSFWFRDYIYMRLMFTLMKNKVFKSRIVTSNVGYFALFLIMGIWHGLTWYYIAYGVFHATWICLNDAWIRFKRKHKAVLPSNRATKALSIFLTFNGVMLSFLIFSGFLDRLWFH